MQVDAGDFINKLRERLALKLDEGVHGGDILGAFDRSCVQVLVEEHKEQLTPQQRGARTRKANREKREKQPLTGGQATNSVDQEAGHGQNAE